jgi:hypothetical protein
MNMQTSIAVVDVVDVVAVVPVVPVVPVGRLGGRAFCSVPPARVAGSSFTCAKYPTHLIFEAVVAHEQENHQANWVQHKGWGWIPK